MISPILVSLVATTLAVPLQHAVQGDLWTQVCCEENDLNKNGGISFREFTPFALKLMNLNRAELERLFLEGDVDRNSELDGEECIPMRSVLKSTLREKSELFLKKYDRNGDQSLSQEEANSLAKKEFGVTLDDLFALSDQNRDQMISAGKEMTDLMLNLRSRALSNGQATLSTFDRNKDGQVSYEEIKREILRSTDGFTLKQVFKAVDFDKDFYLTADEYLALLNELELRQKEGNLSVTPKTIAMPSSTDASRTMRRERVSSAEKGADNERHSSPTSETSPSSASSVEPGVTVAEESSTELSSATSADDKEETTPDATSTSEVSSSTDVHIRSERDAEEESPSSTPATSQSVSTSHASTEDAEESTDVVKSKSSVIRTVTNIRLRDRRSVEKEPSSASPDPDSTSAPSTDAEEPTTKASSTDSTTDETETVKEVTSEKSASSSTAEPVARIQIRSAEEDSSSSVSLDETSSTSSEPEQTTPETDSTDPTSASSPKASKKMVAVDADSTSSVSKLTAIQIRTKREAEKVSSPSTSLFLNSSESSSVEDEEVILERNSTRVSSKASSLLDAIRVRDKRSNDGGMIRVSPSQVIHELSTDEEPAVEEKAISPWKAAQRRLAAERRLKQFAAASRRTKREKIETGETAPPLIEPFTELPKAEMLRLSLTVTQNLRGGKFKPSIAESVTVPYDSKDFN
nr:EF hand domain containing protein [Haemonchus contortus]